ncbi:MAG TPA: tetratricopeptide repeat protein [Bryobacteraceae bacterium]|nr:tetratricopeptide repeat protein [Bryobacteraceae bacterium]
MVLPLMALALVSCSRDPNVVKKRYLDNGNRYFERGRYKEASIMYRNALAKDGLFGPAHYRLALTELKLGRLPQAVASLRRAMERIPSSEPDHWDAAIKLADIYVAVSRDQQHLAEADDIAKGLLERDANSYDGHRLSADLAFASAQRSFAKGDREKADQLLQTSIQAYRKADTVKPEQPGLRMAMSRALAAARQFAEAEGIYKGVIAKDNHLVQAYTELYQLYVWQRKLNEAEETLKTAVANNPKQYGLLTLLASHYYGLRRRDDMVRVLGKMKEHSKEFPQAYLMAGDFYLRVGDGDAAIREYKEGIGADSPRKLEYRKRIIEVLMRQGKKAEAAELNAAILKERPKDTDARAVAGSLLLDKGDLARAVAELQGAVNASPENFVARFHLGRAHMARGEWEQARQQFAEAVKLRPDYIPARLAQAQLQATRGEFEASLKSVQEVLKLEGNNTQARLIESAALLGMKKYTESRQVLDNMLQANPSSPDVLFRVGVVNLAEKKYKEAEDSFRKAYQLNPANSRGLLGIVETYMAQNKADQALELLLAETQKQPGRPDFRIALGNTAVRSGKYDMAIAEFQRALGMMEKESRGAGDLYLRLGETHRRKGDLNSSVAALQKARDLMPENAVVVSTLALTLDGAGRKKEARGAYEQALKLEPSNPIALNNLAFLLAEHGGDLDQALTYAQRAKQILPSLLEVSDTLGWIYLKKNMNDSAIDVFSDLVRRQPNHSTYQYHLGMALSQKGDRQRALKALEGALKSNPQREEAAKIRELMSRIS